MNAAVRAVVRVGIFTGARVFFVHEVGSLLGSPPLSSPTFFSTPSLRCSGFFSLALSLTESLLPTLTPAGMLGPRSLQTRSSHSLLRRGNAHRKSGNGRSCQRAQCDSGLSPSTQSLSVPEASQLLRSQLLPFLSSPHASPTLSSLCSLFARLSSLVVLSYVLFLFFLPPVLPPSFLLDYQN